MIVHDLIRVMAAILDRKQPEVRVARVRDRRQHDAGRRDAHHEQRIDAARREPQLQVGAEEHAGTMREDERFVGLPAKLRRYLVTDEQAKLLDPLSILVQRADFRIARAELDLGEKDVNALVPRGVAQLARIGEQDRGDGGEQLHDVGLVMHDQQSGLRRQDCWYPCAWALARGGTSRACLLIGRMGGSRFNAWRHDG
ncbi:hypothetical protein D3C85_1327100 [compost metagenome]